MSASLTIYHVYQTQEDGDSLLLYSGFNKDHAQDEVDRINSNLAAAGIPTEVSCAYIDYEYE
jgi:vancomycin permeability regulator SanA